MFSITRRYSFLHNKILSIVKSIINRPLILLPVFILFIYFLYTNLIGNIPLQFVPTLLYSFTFSISLLFWLPLIFCVLYTQYKRFLAHILPYGSPIGLILFLPLVELFSQLIRPLTLIIRISTNLSRGHIMLYMFSYFTLMSASLSPFIYIVIVLLFILEICISILQAYIFVSLIVLYIRETVYFYSIK